MDDKLKFGGTPNFVPP